MADNGIKVIPIEEVRAEKHHSKMADLAEIFGHNVVEINGVWRWQPNRLMEWLMNHAPVMTPSHLEIAVANQKNFKQKDIRGSISLNQMTIDLNRGMFGMEEWMKFYMQIGYSLSGYDEIFGQHEASEYKLPGALNEPTNEQDHAETVIDYMIRIHKGKIILQ